MSMNVRQRNWMLMGAMLGLSGLSVPLVEPMIAASVLVFGLLVAARAQKGAVVMAVFVSVKWSAIV